MSKFYEQFLKNEFVTGMIFGRTVGSAIWRRLVFMLPRHWERHCFRLRCSRGRSI